MNHSGDAAEQIVRMSLEGAEVAAKITGTAAKEIAILLAAALKNKNSSLKLKGKARLTSMLKSGKALEIYSVKERDLQKFMQGAKEYGIVYCVLRNAKSNPDGLCDIMVKADDAPKISRLAERFKFATVDKGRIESEIVAEKTVKKEAESTEPTPDKTHVVTKPKAPEDTEKLLDELMGTNEGKTKPVKTKPVSVVKGANDSPPFFKSDPPTTPPSKPFSESKKKSGRAISSKPSVKEELREIAAVRKKEEAPTRNEQPVTNKPKNKPNTTTHKQPQSRKSKSKTKKSRGSR